MSSSEGRSLRRVIVVDDSAFMRRLISDMIGRFPGYRVVGTAADGQEALRLIDSEDPDLVTLDIEMPRVDGFDVLRQVMNTRPLAIVVLSAYTPEGSRSALRALDLGAVDFVPKPSGPISLDLGKVEARLHQALEAASVADLDALVRRTAPPAGPIPGTGMMESVAVGIAASTGGPRALSYLLAGLPPDLGAAVFIVQHMPAGFTATLAARLDRISSWAVSEARGGERVEPGRVWIAPGDFHMRVRRLGSRASISLDQKDAIWGSRPAADALFPTLAEVYGGGCVGVVLTGMGKDGVAGLAAIREAGGRTLAQDRETSVVYGMPAQAIAQGAAERAVSLQDLPLTIAECIGTMRVRTSGKGES